MSLRIYLLCVPVLTPHMTGLPCEPGAVTENWSVSQRVSPLDAVENTYEMNYFYSADCSHFFFA